MSTGKQAGEDTPYLVLKTPSPLCVWSVHIMQWLAPIHTRLDKKGGTSQKSVSLFSG